MYIPVCPTQDAGSKKCPMSDSPDSNKPLLRGLSKSGSNLQELLSSLERLDLLLKQAVAAAQNAYGPGTASDVYRGIYINQDEAERLLARKPGVPVLYSAEEAEEPSSPPDLENSRLAWMKEAFNQSPFDLDVIIIALAPELDLRYERLYAFLQDDITKRRPTVDLALNLLCANAETKLIQRTHFETEAPLIRQGLLRLIPDPSQLQPPLRHIILNWMIRLSVCCWSRRLGIGDWRCSAA